MNGARSRMLAIVLAVCAVLLLLVPVLAVWAEERADNTTEHTQQDARPDDDEPDLMVAAA